LLAAVAAPVGLWATPFPEIATITGHSVKDVEAILDAHYLGPTTKLADSAVAKLERAEADKATYGEQKLQNTESVRFVLPRKAKIVEIVGGRTRTRTLDPLIKRQTLSL
jgi:hypothetical protein